jgi:hypothetical protein
MLNTARNELFVCIRPIEQTKIFDFPVSTMHEIHHSHDLLIFPIDNLHNQLKGVIDAVKDGVMLTRNLYVVNDGAFNFHLRDTAFRSDIPYKNSAFFFFSCHDQ